MLFCKASVTLVAMSSHPQTLSFDENTIVRLAQARLSSSNVIKIALKQAYYERVIRLKKKVSFRFRENEEAREAYRAMDKQEFEGINARQQWANWRAIPRALSGHLPNRPLKALDLCCGVGHSTEVLACYLPKGSEILGLEFNPAFVEIASRQVFKDQAGGVVKTAFRAQSVLDAFCDIAGKKMADESADLVNSCGAIAHHFDAEASTKVMKEVARVLKKGGLATIDSGRAGTSPEALTEIAQRLGLEKLSSAKSCFIDTATQICFRKN